MLDLSNPRYHKPGRSLLGPVDNLAGLLEEIDEPIVSGEVIDGYAFPANPLTDKRFSWIRALHEAALIPDYLTRPPGLAARISTKGVESIPESYRPLFPANFGISSKLPPTAFLHGNADDLVGFELSSTVAEKLESYGVNVLLEEVKGEGHGFDAQEVIDIDDNDAKSTGFSPNPSRVVAFLGQGVQAAISGDR